MMRIGTGAITTEYRQGCSAAFERVFKGFYDHQPRAFAHDEAITIFVERT